MKKSMLSIISVVAAAVFVFAGCSSKGGDFELERSKGVTITYSEDFVRTNTEPVPFTSEEIFQLHSDTIVRGTIESVRNIKIDYGKGEVSFKALATLNMERVLSGDGTAGDTVTVLLPNYVDNASANESAGVLSHFKNGTEGIFFLKKVTDTNRTEMNNKIFYYDDVCDYMMFGENQFAIIESDEGILFDPNLFDGAITSFDTLDKAELQVKAKMNEE